MSEKIWQNTRAEQNFCVEISTIEQELKDSKMQVVNAIFRIDDLLGHLRKAIENVKEDLPVERIRQ